MNDQELELINNSTRIEKFKNFLKKNLKMFIYLISIIFFLLISIFIYKDLEKRKRVKLSNLYVDAVLNFNENNKSFSIDALKKIILKKDKTYSPLALYFLMDKNLIKSRTEINQYFDIIINETKLENNIRNLNIYKKGLFNSDFESEENLLMILNPIIVENGVWTSHALYLMAEYYFDKGEKQKSKEFFNKIVLTEDSNAVINLEARKRLQRDFSD